MSPALPVGSPARQRRGWQRLTVLAAGAVTVAGTLVAIAAPATAVPAGSASPVSRGGAPLAGRVGEPIMDCGPLYGMGGLYCPWPPDRVASASVQDCDETGGTSSSGGRTCAAPTAALATSATLQDCGGGMSSGGGRACEDSAAAPAASATTQARDGGGFKGGGDFYPAEPARAAIAV